MIGFFNYYFYLFRATAAVHGDSQARGQIRAIAVGLCTTATPTQDPSCICDHSSEQCRILNALGEARDQARIRMVPSRVH